MNERSKIAAEHLSRLAVIYLRQSSAAQVEPPSIGPWRESTERQYALADKARELGWPDERILVIDEDLGLSGSGTVARAGFDKLTAEIALARVGLVLGLEVSRLARNNADWHRLIELAGLTDTLIGDGDGLYHPAVFNDRLLLGLKGTMSEAELHVLRARLNGGIRNKAAKGELRRGAAGSPQPRFAACRSAWSGARRTARSDSTPTRPSPTPSPTSLPTLPRPAPRGASGSGSARTASSCPCRCTARARSAGSRPAITPSTASSPTRPMPGRTPMAKASARSP